MHRNAAPLTSIFRLLIILALLTAMPLQAPAAGLPASVVDGDYRGGGRVPEPLFELGRMLFFDKILSGNMNISCASCHHPLAGSGDGLSLPVGEGGRGLGVTRDTGHGGDRVPARVPRNAPPLFNLGAWEFSRLFHDGRVEEPASPGDGFLSPAGDALPGGLDSVLAVQAMFPVTSGLEMAGQAGENEVADAAAADRLAGPGGVWDLLVRRLAAVPRYVELFRAAFPGRVRSAADIRFVDAANAIAAFETVAFRSDRSPFDEYLRGRRGALSPDQRAGMALFYGRARCADCHAGPFQTDHDFHAIAMPQIGPGKDHGESGLEDLGRAGVTAEALDRYRFRTPSLRNVALTAPYGHSGAFVTLEGVLRHHLDPLGSLENWAPGEAVLPSRPDLDAVDFQLMGDAGLTADIATANQLEPVSLGRRQLRQLLAFLHALTDMRAPAMARLVPGSVPSGLPVWD